MTADRSRHAAARPAEGVIAVDGVGIRFKRNRASRRSFKDLFADRDRRTRPGEFWALRDVNFTVQAGRGDRRRRTQRPGQVDPAQARGAGDAPG